MIDIQPDNAGRKRAITRKAIGKKLRFEVFKRDSFTCQYCGGQSPDVVLVVDHIDPIAGGGNSDILNLITACQPCNAGKGARKLDDNSAIARQKAQLDQLNVRREQLEMMLEWRKGLSGIDDAQIDAFNAEFEAATGCALNDVGRGNVRSWLKRHTLKDLLDGLDASVGTYYKTGSEDAEENRRLASEALNMTVRVLGARQRYAGKPYMKDLFYIRAIIRNRCYCNERKAIELLEQAYAVGIDIEDMKALALATSSWTIWHRTMQEWIDERMGGAPE